MPSLKGIFRKGLKDSAFYLAGDTGVKVIRIFVIPVLTGIISVEEFALYDIFLLTSSILLLIAGLGIDSGFAIVIAENKDDSTKIASLFTYNLLAVTVVLTVVFGVFAFVNSIFHILEPIFFQALFIFTFCSGISYACFNLLRYLGDSGRAAMASFFSSILGLLIGVLGLVFIEESLIYFLYGLSIGAALGMIVSLYIARRFIKFKSLIDYKQDFIELLKISIPFVPNYLFSFLVNSLDRIIILSFLGLESAGLYGLASRIGQMSFFGINLVAKGFLPVMYNNYTQPTGIVFIRKVYHWFLLSIIPLFFLVMLLATPLILFFGSDAYLEMTELLPVITLSYLIMAGMGLNGLGFTIKRKTISIPLITGGGVLINLIISFLLIGSMGISGVVIGSLIASGATAFAYTHLSEKHHAFGYSMKGTILIYSACMVLGIGVFLI
jgi:O-antigen/teichoic acid export membrane protein